MRLKPSLDGGIKAPMVLDISNKPPKGANMSYALRSIARNTKSEIAQLLLSADTSVIFDLSANPSLTPLVWGKLWSQKPKLEVAKRLVARQLNKEQISMVLATEKRVNVILEFVKSCRLD
jgi:hypothetical protein